MANNIQSSSQKPENVVTDDSSIVPQPALSSALELIQHAGLELGTKLSLRELSTDLLSFVYDFIKCDYILLFTSDTDDISFRYQNCHPIQDDNTLATQLKKVFFNSYNAQDDPIIGKWLRYTAVNITEDIANGSQAQVILDVTKTGALQSIPLAINNQLYGILLIKPTNGQAISQDTIDTLITLSPHLATYLSNAYTYEIKVKDLEDGMREVTILSQIDEELNATIQLPRVFRMIMDWALRFTNAHAAALTVYNEQADNLQIMEHYGYPLDSPLLSQLQQDHTGGITHRVARNGLPEVIPDVSMDPDYHSINHLTKSQMFVPILREERVEAIITLESKNLNGFTDEHLDFVKRLAQRAGVAVDNARLFTETEQERQKLELILSNIKDIVIVVGVNNRILLINQSALAGLSLHMTAENYIDIQFEEVIESSELSEFFRSGISKDQGMMEEIQLHNGRHYHAQLSPLEGIGWVIVMQDITHFKETDKLKSELLATASHDLKQPLSVMRGYIDLLEMTNTFDERSQRFMVSLNKAVLNMQTLIDELLDLAKIESGIELEMEEVDLPHILRECLEANIQKAEEKLMHIHTDIPENFPSIQGDGLRLSQIFGNLISNAIKYTPPEGEVRVYAEKQGKVIRISIQDNGLGISPEDKAQIFDRFYRVRRAETDSIEGTGLGLAIVKSLVEAHQGEIALVSQLNKGSTFHVTLPIDK
jgi:signal transduction histidine kinase